MKKLSYEEYLDKVYGCWLGKCIAGTIGAPYEGMKQTNQLTFAPEMIEEMLPNDDLDLQVLWLSVLEEKGVSVTDEDLAKCFFEKNIKWPGEYACFRKNYARGIRPPYSGSYENVFYREGMGCPIRSEIWGMILPGNPHIAAELSVIDGTLDHEGDSVYFEKFWTAMVSAAFFESDVQKLIFEGLKEVPENSRAHALILDVASWCAAIADPYVIRSNIIGKYGHCDCTNSYQNIGFSLLALLKGGESPIEAGLLACNLGFDTDCTAGNSGSLLGLIHGASKLADYGIGECRFKLNLRYSRRTDSVRDLAEDTAKVGAHFLKARFRGAEPCVSLDGVTDLICDGEIPSVCIYNLYPTPPYIAPDESVEVDFEIKNNTSESIPLKLNAKAADEFDFSIERDSCVLPASGSVNVHGRVTCRATEYLEETNLFELQATRESGEHFTRSFGIIGKHASVWYGPFWENETEIDLDADGGKNRYSYCNVFTGKDVNERVDNMRRYQLNMITRFDKEYLSPAEISSPEAVPTAYEFRPKPAFLKGDKFETKDFSSFRGPAVYYLKQVYRLPEKRRICLFVGHTDAFELSLDGKLLLSNAKRENYTPENMHYYNLILDAGDHEFVFKLDAPTGNACFGMTLNVDDETGQYPHTRCATRIFKADNI